MNQYHIGNAIENMQLKAENVQTWIFDPPYNVGFKYDACKDNLDWYSYEVWMKRCAEEMYQATRWGGSMFLIHYTIPGARLMPVFEEAGWKVHQWISWVYPHNMGMSKQRFTHGSGS